MNIFFIDRDPSIAAQYHNDSHVRKMILETAQLLSTAHRVLDGNMYYDKSNTGRKVKRWSLASEEDGREEVLYKATHVNHPSAKWVRESSDHYYWTYLLFDELSKEFEYRWEKPHATWMKLRGWLQSNPNNIPMNGLWTDPPLAMDDEYKLQDPVDSYRNYYIHGKRHLAKWTKREKPFWYDLTIS